MSEVLTVVDLTERLSVEIERVNVPELALLDGALTSSAASVVASQVTGGIIAIVTQFLADNADLLPPKEAVLEAVNKAIDAALAKLDRPLVTRLISRTVKNLIANAVDSIYDAIMLPPSIDPRTEV
jgi:hypothetical protein